ncbi:MAG TPA: hypothetical protein VH370_06340 [Humisphaera sp.]|jgi:hypothetical protein|nr:hypothetical protein [Humisphaera sp.]
MGVFTKTDVIEALTRLGELAAARGETIDLVLVGGGVMVLEFEARASTRDLDVLILPPSEPSSVRMLAAIVSEERSWPDDWLNDAAKGFLVGLSTGPILFSASGITVRRPSIEQLLAMKLCAWRDDIDIADARRLLKELNGGYNEVWNEVAKFLFPGRELSAKYGFDDIWDKDHGSH